MPFLPNEPIDFFEGGHFNTRVGTTLSPVGEPIAHFRSLVHEISESRYTELEERALDKRKEAFHLVGDLDGKYYVTGEEAMEEIGFNHKQPERVSRWTREYYGVLMCAALQRAHFGDVPKRIGLYAAHPPKDYKFRKQLSSVLKGNWSWKTPGKKRMSTLITNVSPYDEYYGSVMNVSLDAYGNSLSKSPPVCEGDTICADFGGGTFDVTKLIDGTPDYDNSESFKLGGNEALLRFKTEIETRKDIRAFLGGDEFPLDLVYEIALHPDHVFSDAGTVYDCSMEFKQAFTTFVNQAAILIDGKYGKMVGVGHILITGGIGGLIYDMVASKVFSRWYNPADVRKNRVVRAAPAKYMMQANGEGALKMARATLAMLQGEGS